MYVVPGAEWCHRRSLLVDGVGGGCGVRGYVAAHEGHDDELCGLRRGAQGSRGHPGHHGITCGAATALAAPPITGDVHEEDKGFPYEQGTPLGVPAHAAGVAVVAGECDMQTVSEWQGVPYEEVAYCRGE